MPAACLIDCLIDCLFLYQLTTKYHRDPFYDGNALEERCTTISRIAQTFFRFGSFEIFKNADSEGSRAGPSAGNETLKRKLLDYVIDNYFSPQSASTTTSSSSSDVNRYANFYAEVVRRTALLVAQWQTVGFVHGVLNTDNMSIIGLTIGMF